MKFIVDVPDIMVEGNSKKEVRLVFIKLLQAHPRKIDVRDYYCDECKCGEGRHYGSCSMAMIL